MSTNDTFLAVFLGSKTSAKMAAWIALPEAERRAKEQQGMAAWKAKGYPVEPYTDPFSLDTAS